ncbi:hypothetical protein L4174_016840 [Photobacterium sp. CCB-ST2H9]|uniref:hypothetical protein n=1 Tax=Photobacterium sp. CCB-ST2H9 TaxID=2912855 RepID=UPI002003503D|nr:hypothetical protein [Photobacterium sp. CCB-ST2H9]UTM59741.1 hypothetical protein L4174_016840 [Photobacterium sp. CCB-ST2H9]
MLNPERLLAAPAFVEGTAGELSPKRSFYPVNLRIVAAHDWLSFFFILIISRLQPDLSWICDFGHYQKRGDIKLTLS